MSIDGKFQIIAFFRDDFDVLVRDTEVPNTNVHMLDLARKMIGFKKAYIGKIGLGGLRVYVGGQNLMYVMAKNYVGYNPEGIDQGADNPLTYGYQRGPAPIYRTISFGVNVKL